MTGTEAWWQRASTAATWAVSVGRATTDGTGRDLPGRGPPDGQRPPVPSCLGPLTVVVGDLGTDLVEAAPQGGVDGHPGSAQPIGDPVWSGVDRA